MSDDYHAYKRLVEYGYNHHYSVIHSEGQYVKWHGLVHNNTIESLWSQFKRGIYGVYRNVSRKYLQAYVDEYAWRYNNRKYEDKMFDRLLIFISFVSISFCNCLSLGFFLCLFKISFLVNGFIG